jgi:hypothetical protein
MADPTPDWKDDAPGFTPLEMKVLVRTIEDGGTIELTGLDATPGSNGHWQNAAMRLYKRGLLAYHPSHSIGCISWRITDAGRAALAKARGEQP